jgi:hypothetical protein
MIVMTVVLVVAIVAIGLLVWAILSGNTIVALVVIVLAALGLLLLARDWRKERSDAAGDEAQQRGRERGASSEDPENHWVHPDLEPDEFEPDVDYDEAQAAAEEARAEEVPEELREDQRAK